MKIKKRKYKCPACQHEQQVETNHLRNVYSGCKKCGYTTLNCVEPEATPPWEREGIHTELHYYKLDLTDARQRKMYQELVARLQKEGHDDKPFTERTRNPMLYKRVSAIFDRVTSLDQPVKLLTETLFPNQWIGGCGLRLFDWFEAKHANGNIKQGYYLELTDEIKELRSTTAKCGYCNNTVEAGKECTENEECSDYNTKVIKRY